MAGNSSRDKTEPTDFVISPITVLVDSNEGAPYSFQNLACDSSKSYKPLIIRTKKKRLATGDYSIEGFEDQVTVERKSPEDAYGTFLGFQKDRRGRFKRQLQRMQEMDFSIVVIEGEFSRMVNNPPAHFEGKGKLFYRTVLSWEVEFRGGGFMGFAFMGTRANAERSTFRYLEKWVLKSGNW